MSRFMSLLQQTRLISSDSSASLSEMDQIAAIKETLEGLDALLNDDLESIPSIPGAFNSIRSRTNPRRRVKCLP